MRTIKLCLIILMLIGFSWNVFAAVNVNINVEDSFGEGEMLYFNYTIVSDEDIDLIYTPSINCLNNINPLLTFESVDLESDKVYESYYMTDKIGSDVQPQICEAIIEINYPIREKFKEYFFIETDPVIQYQTMFCKDSNCDVYSRIFYKESIIYFFQSSNIDDIIVDAKLIYPDGSVNVVTIPGSYELGQVGTYELITKVSKKGYKILNSNEQFAVIEKKQIEKSESVCNIDQVCSSNENYKTCPQDCVKKDSNVDEETGAENGGDWKWSVFVLGGVILLILVAIVLRKILNYRKV